MKNFYIRAFCADVRREGRSLWRVAVALAIPEGVKTIAQIFLMNFEMQRVERGGWSNLMNGIVSGEVISFSNERWLV